MCLVVCPGWKWLPACLEPCALLVGVSLWLVLVGSGYLHTLNLVPCWLVCPCALLVGSGYLHALNLVSLVRALLVRAGWK